MLSIRRYLDAFRLSADVDGLGYVARGDVDDADGCLVFVRCVELRAILADVEVFRIRAAMDSAYDLILRDIKDAYPVGRLVGRGKSAFIDIGPGNRRAAEGDINCLVIRAGMNPLGRLPSGTVARTL